MEKDTPPHSIFPWGQHDSPPNRPFIKMYLMVASSSVCCMLLHPPLPRFAQGKYFKELSGSFRNQTLLSWLKRAPSSKIVSPPVRNLAGFANTPKVAQEGGLRAQFEPQISVAQCELYPALRPLITTVVKRIAAVVQSVTKLLHNLVVLLHLGQYLRIPSDHPCLKNLLFFFREKKKENRLRASGFRVIYVSRPRIQIPRTALLYSGS